MKSKTAVQALSALANDNRLAIFRLLVQAGESGINAGAIAEALALPNTTLSFHLKELAHADLIEAEAQGRFIVYRANYARMNDLLAFLTDKCCQGASCAPEKLASKQLKRK